MGDSPLPGFVDPQDPAAAAAFCVKQLSRPMPREPKPPKPSLEQLGAALDDANRYDRSDAFYAYSCYDPEVAALPILRKALHNSEYSVVRSAALSIGKLGPQAAEASGDLFCAAGQSDTKWRSLPQAYSACLKSLLAVGASPDEIIDLIYSHFGHTNWDYPRDSLHALKQLATAKALDLMSRIVTFWWPELHKGQKAYVRKHFPEAVPKALV